MNNKLLIALLVFLTSACSVAVSELAGGKMPWKTNGLGVYKFVDSDENSVCYVYKSDQRGGISCLMR